MKPLGIGLPVYNGEQYLKKALDSILNQGYQDFDLLILDNASTDNTAAICKEYQSRDSRIQYQRNSKNIGAAPNFNKVFRLMNNKYFKWAAHDDEYHPDFLQKLIQALETNPDVVLAYAKTRLIDENSNSIKNYDEQLHTDSDHIPVRFGELILRPHPCFQVFGIIRSDILKRSQLIGSYTSSDRVLLAELALHGKFHKIPEHLFYRRNHEEQSTQAYDLSERAAWFDPQNYNRLTTVKLTVLRHYYGCVVKTPLSFVNRAKCQQIIGKWVIKHWKGLLYDIHLASKYYLIHATAKL